MKGNWIAEFARTRGLDGPRERGSRQEYVHIKPRAVHLLQTGRSPEHFVLRSRHLSHACEVRWRPEDMSAPSRIIAEVSSCGNGMEEVEGVD
jgi:hypothetical protein